MTFEFISVAVSIVLALSAARLLTALPHVLMFVGPAIPVLGIITANERAHALLVLFGAAGIFFNVSRL